MVTNRVKPTRNITMTRENIEWKLLLPVEKLKLSILSMQLIESSRNASKENLMYVFQKIRSFIRSKNRLQQLLQQKKMPVKKNRIKGMTKSIKIMIKII